MVPDGPECYAEQLVCGVVAAAAANLVHKLNELWIYKCGIKSRVTGGSCFVLLRLRAEPRSNSVHHSYSTTVELIVDSVVCMHICLICAVTNAFMCIYVIIIRIHYIF